MKMLRIVHFDLKGAPPKLSYFEQVLHCIKSWGATGVLLEWEDTFPYFTDLAHLGSRNNAGGDELYDIEAVQHIFRICTEMGLEVIQLVQTIGHMEFVLKHACHAHLREYERSPSNICPEKEESKELVKQMVMQVLDVQPHANYFHIGADEVSHLGLCNDCSKKMTGKYPMDNWRIYLDYIQDLVLFIKEQRPNITVLMWDDILQKMTPEILQEYELSDIVQPVVWNYNTPDNFKFPSGMWAMYNRHFPAVWAGSAYKGANGSSQLTTSVKRYVCNQEAWLRQISEASSQVLFVGVILTGWSRYDHFATLCELLPTSLNSLANCLKCYLPDRAESIPELYDEDTLPAEQWPGKSMAQCARAAATLHDACLRVSCGDMKTTWLNAWQVDTGFLNMFQVDNIERYVYSLLLELKSLAGVASNELSVMCGPRTCSEWVRTYFSSMESALADAQRTIGCARRFDTHASVYAPVSGGQALPTADYGSSVVAQAPLMFVQAASIVPFMVVQATSVVAQAPAMVAHESPMFAQAFSPPEESPSGEPDDNQNGDD